MRITLLSYFAKGKYVWLCVTTVVCACFLMLRTIACVLELFSPQIPIFVLFNIQVFTELKCSVVKAMNEVCLWH